MTCRTTGAHFEVVTAKVEMPVPRLRILREVLAQVHLPDVALTQRHAHQQFEEQPALKATGSLRSIMPGDFAVGHDWGAALDQTRIRNRFDLG